MRGKAAQQALQILPTVEDTRDKDVGGLDDEVDTVGELPENGASEFAVRFRKSPWIRSYTFDYAVDDVQETLAEAALLVLVPIECRLEVGHGLGPEPDQGSRRPFLTRFLTSAHGIASSGLARCRS